MGYYEDKRKAYAIIRKLAEEGWKIADIQFYILEKFGYSAKFCEDYYNQLVERGHLK